MCLTTVDSETVKITGGWKIFRIKEANKLFPVIYDDFVPRKGFKSGVWYKCSGCTILADDNTEYDAGFHFFETEKDALDWCEPEKHEVVKKISVRNIVASGWQTLIMRRGQRTTDEFEIFLDELRVFVAKEMRIDE